MLNFDNPSRNPFHFISASFYSTSYMHYIEIEKALREMYTLRRKLLTIPYMLEDDGYVRPIECDQAVNILNLINKAATIISTKLRSLNELQAFSGTNYYRLLMYLYSTNDKSSKANEALKQFRSICMDSTIQQHRMFIKTQRDLLEITRTCEHIDKEAGKLLDSMLLNTN